MGLEHVPQRVSVPRPQEVQKRNEERWEKLEPPRLERSVEDPREMIGQLCADETRMGKALEMLTRLLDKIEHDETLGKNLKEELERQLGKKFGPQILDSWEYRLALHETAETLDKTMPNSEKPVCSVGGLRTLIAVHEVLGKQAGELISAADMRTHVSEPLSFDESAMDDGFIDLEALDFDPFTGELMASISMGDDFTLENERVLSLQKYFERRALPVEKDGSQRYERVLNYDHFSVPDDIQSKGYAAKEFAATMKPAIEAGIDRMTLHANISIGGYAWASYGFGWDARKTAEVMVADYLNDLDKKKKEGIEPDPTADVAQVAPGINSPSHLTDEQIVELQQRFTSTFVFARRQVMTRLLRDAGLMKAGGKPPKELAGVWAELRDMEAHPETATPQRLATLGQELELRVSPDELESPMPSHIGKAAMIWSSWYGSIDLSTDNDNRKILLAKLAKAAKL